MLRIGFSALTNTIPFFKHKKRYPPTSSAHTVASKTPPDVRTHGHANRNGSATSHDHHNQTGCRFVQHLDRPGRDRLRFVGKRFRVVSHVARVPSRFEQRARSQRCLGIDVIVDTRPICIDQAGPVRGHPDWHGARRLRRVRADDRPGGVRGAPQEAQPAASIAANVCDPRHPG